MKWSLVIVKNKGIINPCYGISNLYKSSRKYDIFFLLIY